MSIELSKGRSLTVGPRFRIGMSGWTYEGWRGGFYPKGLVQRRELEFASRQVNSIEINGTFYALQKPASFQKWHDETPENFIFSVKAPQYMTHVRRLKDIEEPLANFFASGLFCLKKKLGPILWQFPPSLTLKDDRFEKFLKLLPYDLLAASSLAKRRSSKMDGRDFLDIHENVPVLHAFEFRHPSFMNRDFLALLRGHGVAVVFAHSGGIGAPYTEDICADFVYARMHGEDHRFKEGHTEEFLLRWAMRVKCWSEGGQPADADCLLTNLPKVIPRDVYVYFDTAAKEFAPLDALNLMKCLAKT